MNGQKSMKILSPLIGIVLALLITPASVFSQCTYEPDAPDCPCFNNAPCPIGSPCLWWDPGASGDIIQDIALATVGTLESCLCSPSPCHVDDDGGKPYYQMVLGMNSQAGALAASYILWAYGPDAYHRREEWCSETVSYWHREAGIPYPGGYRNDWHMNWQNYCVVEMLAWYWIEGVHEGRGRWLFGNAVDYRDFELGVTVPVPGAYVAIRKYTYGPPATWYSFDSSHSLMINEMWVHKDALDQVFRVEVTLLEGNSGKQVKDTRRWDDILSLTTQGSQWIGTDRKIYGFGVDLNSSGDPIYDPARLHWVSHPDVVTMAPSRAVTSIDRDWDEYCSKVLPLVQAYAALVKEKGGPKITSSTGAIKTEVVPDGLHPWHFSKELSEAVQIEIDLWDVHPVPIKGIELRWEGSYFPRNYSVFFAGDNHEFQEADLPDLSKLNLPESPTYPIPAMFSTSDDGVSVRYVKLLFPKGSFQKDATLQELRFHYADSRWEDAKDVAEGVYTEVPIDIRPKTCPNPLSLKSKGVLPVAILGTKEFDVTRVDPDTIRLEGRVAPLRWALKDVARPNTKTAKEACSNCTRSGPDGYVDLTMDFSIPEIVGALGEISKGACRNIILQGQLKKEHGGTLIRGNDYVKIGK